MTGNGTDLLDQQARKQPPDNKNTRIEQTGIEQTSVAKGDVLVDVSAGSQARPIIAHAMAIADGLQRNVRLLEVSRHAVADSLRPEDPVIWELQQREAQANVDELAACYTNERCHVKGQVVDQLSAALPDQHLVGMQGPIIGFRRRDDRMPGHMDDSMRLLLEAGRSSLFVVPGRIDETSRVTYQRILVPLDGSARAERAIAPALAIARRHGAGLLFVHVIPELQITCSHQPDSITTDLTRQLRERNRRAGEDYLTRLQQRITSKSASVSNHLLNGGDVRRQLLRAAADLNADLIVISAHGASGHADAYSGSVATFILEHAAVPVLMMNAGEVPADSHLYSEVEAVGVRRSHAGMPDE